MNMNICVYFLYRMAYDNNIVSTFRDLCLETAVQFIDHQDKCEFNLNTAEDILQDGRLFMIIFRNRCVRSKY